MLKKLAKHLWHARREFARYVVIGGSSFIADLGSLYLFKTYLHWSPTISVVVNQLVILTYIFLMNKYWSFKAHGHAHKQLFRFIILSLGNYTFSVLWIWFFTEAYTIHLLGPDKDYLLFRLINVLLSVAWNFLLYKHWVYSNEKALMETVKTIE